MTAYDADTGKLIWRFYLVPGKPGTRDGAASDDVMQMAARTWTGKWWQQGGGGAAWNAMTYDPEFNRACELHRSRSLNNGRAHHGSTRV